MDRRVILAVVLMMAIAMLPAVLFKRSPVANRPDAAAVSGKSPAAAAAVAPPPTALAPAAPLDTSVAQAPERVIRVTGPLFTYGISTRGARLVQASLTRHKSMAPGESEQPAEIVVPNSALLGLALLAGRDTLSLRDWDFTPSAESLDLTSGTTVLTLQAARGEVGVTLTYRFTPALQYLRSIWPPHIAGNPQNHSG